MIFGNFSNLTSVGRGIYIQDNPNVTSIDLSNVGGSMSYDITIEHNHNLTTLSAPEFVTSVAGGTVIRDNPN